MAERKRGGFDIEASSKFVHEVQAKQHQVTVDLAKTIAVGVATEAVSRALQARRQDRRDEAEWANQQQRNNEAVRERAARAARRRETPLQQAQRLHRQERTGVAEPVYTPPGPLPSIRTRGFALKDYAGWLALPAFLGAWYLVAVILGAIF